MKDKALMVAAVLLLALAMFAPVHASDEVRVQRAFQFIDRLDAGAFETANEHFGRQMNNDLRADRLREIWETLPTQVGPRVSRGDPRMDGPETVIIPLHHQLMTLDARISFDGAHHINGFWLRPGTSPPAEAAPTDPEERDLTIGDGEFALPGTLTLPAGDGPFPAVVLVHGSGPNDRDQRVGGVRVFRDIAHGLAARGIASLRYDKRTLVHPTSLPSDFTVEHETVADAVLAVAALRALPEVDGRRVFVVGHSLGAMLTPRIVVGSDAAGAVMLATPARHLMDIVEDQLTFLISLGRLREEDRRTALTHLRAGSPAAYWADIDTYDQVAAARALSVPVLLVHGGRDYQVTDADWSLWVAAMTDERHTLKVYDALNHLLVVGEGPSTPDEYLQPGSVDATLIADLAAWIHAR